MKRKATVGNLEEEAIDEHSEEATTEEITYHLLTNCFIRASQSDYDWDLHIQVAECHDDSLRDHVASRQATENVDKNRPDARIRAYNAERGLDSLRSRLASCVEEIGTVAPFHGEGIHGIHGKTGTIDWCCQFSLMLLP